MKRLNEQDFLEWADRYLNGELRKDEILQFKQYCQLFPEDAQLFDEHQEFISTYKKTQQRSDFKKALLQHKPKNPSKEKTQVISISAIWNRLKLNVAVAAAIAIVSVFSTLWLTGYYSTLKKTTSDYSALRRDMNNVKRNVNAHNAAIRSFNKDKNTDETTYYGATSFMITKNGYVVTNYHVINGADSIRLQNNGGDTFKAEVIFTSPEKDLAILHINDSSFRSLKQVPYTFKNRDSDIGEDIFTIGFPRDEAVYGQGYLSSSTGYAGDTLAYQISIPVNPGNSGGPVLDKDGNVIGIISGKQKGIDGAAFAIKTKALMETLEDIPADLLPTEIIVSNKNTLNHLSRTEQIKRLQDYIYIVKVY